MYPTSRRRFLRTLGVTPAALPFVLNLPSLAADAPGAGLRKKRLVVVFSPNGVIPSTFWPDANAESFTLPESLKPLEPFKDQVLTLQGVNNSVKGDGDDHMRGIGCLLTGAELMPGNVQGGGHTPAGWSSGRSVDQEIKSVLQSDAATRTRFGSLEFGVHVPDRADTWTRMVYAGPNKPIAPISNPYQMFAKLYGSRRDSELVKSVLDDIQEDFKRVESMVSDADRRLLSEHAELVRSMERTLMSDSAAGPQHAAPELEPDVSEQNDDVPKISRMQIELLVSGMLADFSRVATLQYTHSVGGLRLRWIGVDEGHHELSHEPDKNAEAVDKLTRINAWYCGEIAHLAKRLSETPEPGGDGSLLENTVIVWTNELGKGNSHTHVDTPFVLIGGGLGTAGGRTLHMGGVHHNRLLLWLAQQFGSRVETFGNPDYCGEGPLTGLV
ncbi:hypothetical protein KOR34_34120 [Posidoniimonas corsicana]|uniref:DUF1552 domain-containing protein n=1 Tax=Posidoniimonas corsicana TaxID=1938618 RepID=A0A5C5V678_9BACT|nr:DUF1552 domain-containing protein [Posidoniimonas corsicana]TWT33580.1 hypothetical protein KOR34_34120 [Posidoniimonas corsicana]